MMMRAVPPICASFQLPFPQQPSFQDANRKKQNVSVVVSLSRAQFAMHICLLCLTLAMSFIFLSGSLLSETTSSTYRSQVSHLVLIL